jgi:hypothetical protein
MGVLCLDTTQIGAFVGFSSIFLMGILILKGSLRDVFISRSALKGKIILLEISSKFGN